MNLYLYKIGTGVPALTMEDVISYTDGGRDTPVKIWLCTPLIH